MRMWEPNTDFGEAAFALARVRPARIDSMFHPRGLAPPLLWLVIGCIGILHNMFGLQGLCARVRDARERTNRLVCHRSSQICDDRLNLRAEVGVEIRRHLNADVSAEVKHLRLGARIASFIDSVGVASGSGSVLVGAGFGGPHRWPGIPPYIRSEHRIGLCLEAAGDGVDPIVDCDLVFGYGWGEKHVVWIWGELK
jgi:hypothetical protein